jgi:hypothetical protein
VRSARKRRPPPAAITRRSITSARAQELEALRSELARRTADAVPRWNANPEDVRRSVAKLVLSLVEFLRKLMERQAIRRMEAETLSVDEVEAVGLALMRLEETVRDLAARFELSPEDLNLDLGPLGRLM